MISLSTLRSICLYAVSSLAFAPVSSALPFGSNADCLQKNLAAYIYFAGELSERKPSVPITEPIALKLFYGKWLTECHSVHLMQANGVSRSVREEVAYRRARETYDRQISLVINEYIFDGNYDSVFNRSSLCVPEPVREECLGTIISE